MTQDELQVENGNFTRIINPLIENLIKIPFRGCELNVAMFIIRKTYGFNKTEDEISLSQICEGVNRTKPAVCLALKNLQLVKVAKLVKQGNNKGEPNIWKINKYVDTWELVKVAKLVKHNHKPSKAKRFNLVKTALHTKDNIQKTITKDNIILHSEQARPDEINQIIELFKPINPTYTRLFANKTERKAVEELIKLTSFDRLQEFVKLLPEIIIKPYAPRITTPYQLLKDMGKLKAFMGQETKKQEKHKIAII